MASHFRNCLLLTLPTPDYVAMPTVPNMADIATLLAAAGVPGIQVPAWDQAAHPASGYP